MEDGRYYYGITDENGNYDNNRLSELISIMPGLGATALNITAKMMLYVCLGIFVLKETLT